LCLKIKGRVQGVGFRPAVYRLARRFNLTGFVRNTSSGVSIEVQGVPKAINNFISSLKTKGPRQAIIESLDTEKLKNKSGDKTFLIIKSKRSGHVWAGMPPDLAICALCRHELLDPTDRRFQYPFINCTDCGPRYTIIKSLPYDRQRTTMKCFKMCSDCRAEFINPANRRFEAQPNACPVCGPQVHLIDRHFKKVAGDPFVIAVKMLKAGKILAIKGIGGYHICCDALNDKAVRILRKRKNRPHKSFAVMFRSLAQARKYCEISAPEERELRNVAAPIVVIRTKKKSRLQKNISPDTRDMGVFLPYSPLHCVLLDKCGPLVMTSGNLSDEPIAINDAGLKNILGKIADAALSHDREILRRCDDSVLKMFKDGTMMIRRSRGFVPSSIPLPVSAPPILACGAELKNTVCVTRGDRAFLSPYIGDLDDFRNYSFFRESARDFMGLLEIKPAIIAYDMHPDYISTRFALAEKDAGKEGVQHHHAHIASCIAEHNLSGKVIGLALDGTGYGDDGTTWGGEILIADLISYRRVGHLRQYPMPGGDAASLIPARMALGILAAEFGAEAVRIIKKNLPSLKEEEVKVLTEMVARKIHSPLTSSAGRLFDAVSALLGFSGKISYEGQAAVRLQVMADESVNKNYPHEIKEEGGMLVLSFAPAIRAMLCDLEKKAPRGHIAGMFHNTIAIALSEACGLVRAESGLNTVALSGGVFQNDLLVQKLMSVLKKDRFNVYINVIVPPNDGGISLGQAAVAAARSHIRARKDVRLR